MSGQSRVPCGSGPRRRSGGGVPRPTPAVIAKDERSCNRDYMSTDRAGAAADAAAAEIRGWCLGMLPDGWFTGPPEVVVDREEITVIGELPAAREGKEPAEGAAGDA